MISIENYARLQVFRVDLQTYDALRCAQLIWLSSLKPRRASFSATGVWLITQQIVIEHAYPVLIE